MNIESTFTQSISEEEVLEVPSTKLKDTISALLEDVASLQETATQNTSSVSSLNLRTYTAEQTLTNALTTISQLEATDATLYTDIAAINAFLEEVFNQTNLIERIELTVTSENQTVFNLPKEGVVIPYLVVGGSTISNFTITGTTLEFTSGEYGRSIGEVLTGFSFKDTGVYNG